MDFQAHVLGELQEIKVNLREHMRRSAALEEQNTLTRQMLDETRKDVEPLKAHVAAWGGVSKLFAILATCAGLLFAALKAFG